MHQWIEAEKKIIRAEIASSPKSLARFLSVTMEFCGNVDKHDKIHLSKFPHYRSPDSNTQNTILFYLSKYREIFIKKKKRQTSIVIRHRQFVKYFVAKNSTMFYM